MEVQEVKEWDKKEQTIKVNFLYKNNIINILKKKKETPTRKTVPATIRTHRKGKRSRRKKRTKNRRNQNQKN